MVGGAGCFADGSDALAAARHILSATAEESRQSLANPLIVMSRSRPPVGWIVAVGVLANFLFRGVVAAGISTALIVEFIHPPRPVWIFFLIALTIAVSLIELRREAPQWFAWLVARAARSHDSK